MYVCMYVLSMLVCAHGSFHRLLTLELSQIVRTSLYRRIKDKSSCATLRLLTHCFGSNYRVSNDVDRKIGNVSLSQIGTGNNKMRRLNIDLFLRPMQEECRCIFSWAEISARDPILSLCKYGIKYVGSHVSNHLKTLSVFLPPGVPLLLRFNTTRVVLFFGKFLWELTIRAIHKIG